MTRAEHTHKRRAFVLEAKSLIPGDILVLLLPVGREVTQDRHSSPPLATDEQKNYPWQWPQKTDLLAKALDCASEVEI